MTQIHLMSLDYVLASVLHQSSKRTRQHPKVSPQWNHHHMLKIPCQNQKWSDAKVKEGVEAEDKIIDFHLVVLKTQEIIVTRSRLRHLMSQ